MSRTDSKEPQRAPSAARLSGYRRALFAGSAALAAACVLGYQDPAPAESARPRVDDAVLRVGGEVVRIDDVQAQVDRTPPALLSRYASPEGRRAFFDQVVKNEILASEAKRAGYDKKPEVILAMKRAMVLEMLRDRIGAAPLPAEVTEAEVEGYYRTHAEEFIRPEEARVTQVVLRTEGEAREALREAHKANDPEAFRAIVFKRSIDKRASEDGGDLTLVSGDKNPHPEPLVKAAFALRRAGELSPVIETLRGFHVLRLRQRVPGSTRTLEESRARIAKILSDQSRDRRVDELVARLAPEMDVEVFEDKFDEVRFDAPARTP